MYGSLAVAAGEGTTGKKYAGGRLGCWAGALDLSGSASQTCKIGTMVGVLHARPRPVDHRCQGAAGRSPVEGPGASASGTGPTTRPQQYDATAIGIGRRSGPHRSAWTLQRIGSTQQIANLSTRLHDPVRVSQCLRCMVVTQCPSEQHATSHPRWTPARSVALPIQRAGG